MKTRKGDFRPAFVLHTFLLALYPVLALAEANSYEIDLAETLRAFWVVLALAGLTLLALKALLTDWSKAAVLATLLFGFVFGFGHVYELLSHWPLAALLLIWVVGFTVLAAVVIYQKSVAVETLGG